MSSARPSSSSTVTNEDDPVSNLTTVQPHSSANNDYEGFSAQSRPAPHSASTSEVSDKQNLEFRMKCQAFLTGVVQKLQNKSPLLYSLAKALGAFDPRRMADSSCHEVNRTHLRVILKQMNEAGRISDIGADAAQQQYTMFLDEVMKQSSQFARFNLTGS